MALLRARGSLVLLFVLGGVSGFGQLYTGSITGTVKDPSGSVIPNAQVTITDAAKGFKYSAASDAGGQFTVKNLPPATYNEEVNATGFNAFQRNHIVLEVNGNINADASLQLSSAGQTVTVTEAGATQLQTEDATTGQTINQQFIHDLPLVGRSLTDLAYLAPGVSQPPGNAYQNVGTNYQNNFVSAGSRNSQADILVDGISATSYEQNTGFVTPLYVPSIEAVQEFRIEQSNFSAEIGFSSGSVINLVTQSGTNNFHGELYEFFRNTDLNANSFFNNAAGIDRAAFHFNNFGGTVGGPIIKNRLFFFFDYDGTRSITPGGAGTIGVPSQAERNGNFGELCGDKGGAFNAQGQCSAAAGQIWDPYSAVQNQTFGTGGLRQTFVPFNNMTTYASNAANLPAFIARGTPGNLINPIARTVMGFYPLPNTGGIPGTAAYNPYGNFTTSTSNTGNNNQYDIKLDNRFTDSDQISVRFSQAWSNGANGNIFGNALDSYTAGPNTGVTYSGAVNYTHTINPTTLLTLVAGYDHNWSHSVGLAADFPDVSIESLGFSPTVASQLRQSGFNGLPAFNLGQYAQENGNASIGGQPYAGLLYGRDVYHWLGSVGHTVGGHDLHMGAEYRVHRINFAQYGYPNGQFSFNQGGTSNFQNVGGDSLATLLTGFANASSIYEIIATPATQNFQYGFFVQDNWHVNSRLTLNLGLRYDVDHARSERYNNMSYFDPNAPSPLIGTPGVPDTGSFEYVGENGNSRNPYNTSYGAIGPRFGLAYRIGRNTTLRGGYGIYYDPTKSGAAGTGSGSAGFQGFDQQTNFGNYANGSNFIPSLILGQPLAIQLPTGKSGGVRTNLGGQLNGVPVYTYDQVPSEQSWSFGIQHQLPWQTLVDAEYVGRKGTHLYFGGDNYSLNHLSATAAAAFRADPNALQSYVPVPAGLQFGNYNTWPAFNNSLPYPQYPVIDASGINGLTNVDPPFANSSYNSFQLRIQKRMTQGFNFLFTYTNQKSLDDSSIAGGNVYINGYPGSALSQIQDPNNLKLERSLSQFDVSQIVSLTAVYELPFGHGKRFGGNSNWLVNGVLGGWQVNGIYRWDTGQPLPLFLNGGTQIPTFGSQRPNLPTALHFSGTASPNSNFFTDPTGAANASLGTSDWFPAAYTDGTAPRTIPNVRAPGANTLTASVFKSFPLGFREGARIEFRAEANNLLNQVQFGAPGTTVGQQNFGVITTQANQPRALQLALKVYF